MSAYHMCRRGHSPRRTRKAGWVLDPITSKRVAEIRMCGECGYRIDVYRTVLHDPPEGR